MNETSHRRPGLRARLGRLFAVQLTVIGTATLIGIFITQLVVEDLLTRRALNAEAAHFWALWRTDPQQALPNTANLRGYLMGPDSPHADRSESLPAALHTEAPGFRRLHLDGFSKLVHVSDQDGFRLYLVFEAGQVSDLAFYFGTLPLSIVLLLIYGLLFVAYRWSQAALSPIVRIARQLDIADLDNINNRGGLALDFASLRANADTEVATMIDALEHFAMRLTDAVERERLFTRDAGHELRTPLAVFKGSLDLLERNRERPAHDHDALKRMRRTADEMESLLETLLLLARNAADNAPPASPTPVASLLLDEVEAMQAAAEKRGNVLSAKVEAETEVDAPVAVLRSVVGNLLRNAIAYTTDGVIEVTLFADGIRVEDNGIGMSREELANMFEPFYRAEASRGASKGHGLGLAIVRRLCRQYGWTTNARSQPGQGTTVEIRFAAHST
ncbi:MAG: HAMP domain-containing sensor histidine kinase [Gammaproteobacteria bacterium]|nr:HAMP domain-containing sensor histidine kinase [Gammaproteobacteria bacterium]